MAALQVPEIVTRNRYPKSSPEIDTRNRCPKSLHEIVARNHHPKSLPEVVTRNDYPRSLPEIISRKRYPKRTRKNPNSSRTHPEPRILVLRPSLHTCSTFSIYEQVLSRNMERFRGGLVFKANRLVNHSRVIKKRKLPAARRWRGSTPRAFRASAMRTDACFFCLQL